jgi:hypothetical protein
MTASIVIIPWELDASRPTGEMEPYFEGVKETMAP